MTDRRRIRLGDVFELDNRRLGDHGTEPQVLSLSKYDGFVPADAYFSKRIASAQLHAYKVVNPDAWAFSTIHIDEGSIARNRSGHPGVISPMYTTLRWVGIDDEPAYFELLLRSPDMLAAYSSHAQGSVNRRRSLSFQAFADLTVEVPEPQEQLRIVDLIGALDDNASALAREAAGLEMVLMQQLERFLGDVSGADSRTLGGLCHIGSGPSWSATDESATSEAGGLRVLKITNTQPGGRLDLSEQTFVTGLPKSTVTLDDASLILIRTNGNRSRIGNVYRPSREALGAAVSAFQFIAKTSDTHVRDYLFAVLRTPSVQSRMSEAASGSTGLGNLSVSWLKTLTIPWPDESQRAAHIAQGDALDRNITAIQDELKALHLARTALLGDLIHGEVRIAGTYDALLEST